MSRGPGVLQKKIILLLLGGLTLGLSGSPQNFFRIKRLIAKEWREINRQALWRAIRDLYRTKLVAEKFNKDGSITLVLSEKGREYALTYELDSLTIPKPRQWDRKWRIIIFDIPEEDKKIRETLRFHLRHLGFKELQKSVFIYPYPCDKEVDFIIEFFGIRRHVRKIIAESIDSELHYKQKFGLL